MQNVETTVQNAMEFLENQDLNTLKEDPYVLAVVTYALALSNSTMKRTYNDELKAIAGKSNGKNN